MKRRSVFTLSLCIATHERPALLGPSLEAIGLQIRPPDEIVISDSSRTHETASLVEDYRRRRPQTPLRYLRTGCSALPWHRWNAFEHSAGELVLFLDDDIALLPEALSALEDAYAMLFAAHGTDAIAGVGLLISSDDPQENERRPKSFEEFWLGISHAQSASITQGGIGVPPKGLPKGALIEVGRLSGGGMSFRRATLSHIGLLDNLVDLFNQGIGPSEDAVLSHYARRQGRLFMLTKRLALHPGRARATHTVDASGGWQMGMRETRGRAFTMRWMASDPVSCRKAWVRVASLEVLRAMWWGIARKPLSGESWSRLAGSLYGTASTLARWGQIPASATSGRPGGG